MPGAPGGVSRKAKGKNAKKGKVKSGNPAKAAAERQALEERRSRAGGGVFGPGGMPDLADFDPSQLDLPAGFEKYLKDR